MKTLPLVALAVLVCAPALMAGPKKPTRTKPIRIFVFAQEPEGGFVDEGSKARADSIKDLSKALAKKKAVELVQVPDAAHIVVEITGRSYEETGGSTVGRSAWGSLKTTPSSAATVRARVTAGAYSSEMAGRAGSEQLFSEWSTAAADIAGQIDKLIDMNYEKIVAPQ